MNEYISGILVGSITGFLVLIVCLYIVVKKGKTDGKLRCEYDERQELSRGRGFKYGFFTLLILNMLVAFYSEIASQPIADVFGTQITTSCIGILVYVTYCIWHDSYFALNERRKPLLIVFAVVGIANFILGFSNVLAHDREMASSDMMNGIGNIMIGFMFLAIFVVLLLKEIKDRKEDKEE